MEGGSVVYFILKVCCWGIFMESCWARVNGFELGSSDGFSLGNF